MFGCRQPGWRDLAGQNGLPGLLGTGGRMHNICCDANENQLGLCIASTLGSSCRKAINQRLVHPAARWTGREWTAVPAHEHGNRHLTLGRREAVVRTYLSTMPFDTPSVSLGTAHDLPSGDSVMVPLPHARLQVRKCRKAAGLASSVQNFRPAARLGRFPHAQNAPPWNTAARHATSTP